MNVCAYVYVCLCIHVCLYVSMSVAFVGWSALLELDLQACLGFWELSSGPSLNQH